MTQVVEFPLDGGDFVLVEVSDLGGGDVDRVGRAGTMVRETGETLQDVLRGTRSAIESVLGQMRDMAEPPDKVTLKFGIKFTASAGVVVAKAASEANFELTVEWAKPSAAPGT